MTFVVNEGCLSSIEYPQQSRNICYCSMIRRALSVILREGLPATTFPQVVDSLRHHGVKRAFCNSSSAQSSSLASVISEEFRRDADKASADIAALPETLRMKVLHALTQDMESPGNVKYISTLLRHADYNNDGVLQLCVPVTAVGLAAAGR